MTGSKGRITNGQLLSLLAQQQKEVVSHNTLLHFFRQDEKEMKRKLCTFSSSLSHQRIQILVVQLRIEFLLQYPSNSEKKVYYILHAGGSTVIFLN
jgi:hypothetical protein